MPIKKLRDFLDRAGVSYETVAHSIAYTSNELASATHTPRTEIAKTVIVLIDGVMAMAVLPASLHVDLRALQTACAATHVSLAKEELFRGMFPDCEVGAMPPFGNLYGMRVFVDESLAQKKHIAFNAGSHVELVRLTYEDFSRLVGPTLVSFAVLPEPEQLGSWHL